MKAKAGQQKILSRLTKPPAVKKFAAAVSGGCDSVAMLLLLRDWCRMRRLELCVFHVDHSLRTTSAADSLWVKDLATRLGLDFYQRKALAGDHITGEKIGSEAWARNFRYCAFVAMLEESGAEAVATGHSADDQAETVIMRLMRGCSWQGLGGIGSRVRLRFAEGNLLVWRPLLNATRAELEAYLNSVGQDWREDETNQTAIYFRNRVRHQLLPLMNELQSGASKHLSALSSDVRLVRNRVSRLAAAYIKKYGTLCELQVYITPECTLRREIIRRWLCRGDRPDRVDRALILRVDKLWVKSTSGNRAVYNDFCVRRLFDRLVVEKAEQGYSGFLPDEGVPLRSDEKLCNAALGNERPVEMKGWRFFLSQKKSSIDNNTSFFFIPAEFTEALQIRCRQTGDRFYPKGSSGGKKLARWFIDRKIPVERRDHLPLVVFGNTILLITGYASSRFLQNEQSGDGLWLSVSQIKEGVSE